MLLDRYDPFRHDPFTKALSLLSTFRDVFEDWPSATRASSWAPPCDVFEDKERITFSFDVPGVRKEDLAVRVEDNVLTVEGSRKLEYEAKKDNYHRIERVEGRFSRSFTLPSTVSTDQIDAELKDGVLRVTLSKRAETKPRSIEIR